MNDTVTLRPAVPQDASVIHGLIVRNLEAGHLLPRTAPEIERHAARFVVAESGGAVIGCAELAPLSDSVAEVRSLVVDDAHRGRQIGAALVNAVASAGRARGFATLCAFTHDPSHFVRMGFSLVPHVWVPEKIQHDCTSCALFRKCGQYAVTFPLRAGAGLRPQAAALTGGVGRAVAPRRPAIERLHLRPEAGEVARPHHEAVPA